MKKQYKPVTIINIILLLFLTLIAVNKYEKI